MITVSFEVDEDRLSIDAANVVLAALDMKEVKS